MSQNLNLHGGAYLLLRFDSRLNPKPHALVKFQWSQELFLLLGIVILL